MRTCYACKQSKPDSEFSKSTRDKTGLRPDCKECGRIFKAKYRAENSDKLKASQARYRAENKKKIAASSIEYYKKNRNNLLIKCAKYYSENTEKAIAACLKWQAKNRDKIAIYSQNRRARKLGNGEGLSKGLQEKLFKLQRGKCPCCNFPLGNNYHMDHKIPLALGGKNEDLNIQLLRAKCNRQKNVKDPIDFMQSRGFLL